MLHHAAYGLAAAATLLGCPEKSQEKNETSHSTPAPVASVEVTPSSRPPSYRIRTVENGRGILIHVSMGTHRSAGLWPIPGMVRSQCGGTDHVVDEAMSASAEGGVNGAVVWLDDIHEGRPLVPATAVLGQKGCVFAPHILALPAAGTLTLSNGDPANHADRFEFGGDGALDFMKTLPGGGSVTVPIQEEWAGRIARVSCPIHLWMGGYALFFEHPYFGVTEAGTTRLEGVPPGDYHLVLWHEGTTPTYDSAIKLSPPHTVRVEVSVGVADVERAFVIADNGSIALR
jgi:hypothetical protein